MELREELQKSIVAKLKAKSAPLDGFYAPENTKEAILAVIVSGRHLLLNGPPGTGKTTLAKILASLLPPMQVVAGCRYNCDPEYPVCPDCLGKRTGPGIVTIDGKKRFIRVQGSPELMPEDLLGDIDPVMAMQHGIYDPRAFTPGKIQRANRKILFIDELNRIPERTQNTLIEVLEERITTIAGFDINIPVDTVVIATQNPEEYAGADRISETLSDRFERILIGYPTAEQEVAILERYARRSTVVKFDSELLTEVVRISQSVKSSQQLPVPRNEIDNLIAAIVGRIRKHPDVVRGTSVRGAIAFKEVLQGFREIQNRLMLGSIDETALVTLPPRIATRRDTESTSALVSDIVKEVLYGFRLSKGGTETALSDKINLLFSEYVDKIDLLSPEYMMADLSNLNLDSEHLSQKLEQLLYEKGQIVMVPDQEELQRRLVREDVTRAQYQQEKHKLEEMLNAIAHLDPLVSGKEIADTMLELMDARDKQWEEEKEISFDDMYVYYRMNRTGDGDYVSTLKRDSHGFRVLVDYLEQRGLLGIARAGRRFTLTGRALDTLLEHLMAKAWGELELRSMVNYSKAWLTERSHDTRRYTVGDVFRDISVRRTLKEIAKRKKKLSDIQRCDFKVFVRKHHKSQSDIVLCIDSSNSMGFGQKLIYARLVAARLAKAAIENGDRVGVVTFDDLGRTILPLSGRRRDIFDYIISIDSEGNTNIGDGVKCAAELLLGDPSKNQKHIVLVTDGESTAISKRVLNKLEPRKEKNLTEESAILETRKASSSGVVVSVIYVNDGKKADRDLVKNIAKAGKGQIQTISTVHDIRLMTK